MRSSQLPNAPRSMWRSGWQRLTRVWRPDTVTNVDDELRFHFSEKVAEFEAQGLSSAAARVRAEEEFGDVQSVRDSLSEIDGRVAKKQRRAEWWEGVVQDLRYVVRGLRKSPMFTATVVTTLALGLGANAAVFSLLDQLYVQSPPGVPAPAEVHRIYQSAMNRGSIYVRGYYSYLEIRALHRINADSVRVAGYRAEKARLGREADGAELNVAYVEGDFFGVSGVGAAVGRVLTPEESQAAGLDALAVISYDLWQREFAGDSAIVGRSIDLGSHRHLVVGVAAEKFRGLDMSVQDIWLPLNTVGVWKSRKPDWYEDGNFNGINAVFRTKNSARAELFNARATVELRKTGVALMSDTLATTALGSINVARGGAESYAKEFSISTRLAGVSFAILLIAIANVINLLLARAVTRQREIAVRLALGVSRSRLLTQLMLESAVLAALSAGAALAVAYAGTTTLRKLLLPDIQWNSGVVDGRTVVFTVGLALLAGFVTGLVPALQTSSPSLTGALKSSVRDGGQRRGALRSSLLVVQAAISVVLVAGAGVFLNSLRSVQAVNIGYTTDNLFFASVSADRELGDRRQEIQRRIPEIVEKLRNIPGVAHIAMSEGTPMYSISFAELHLPGRDSLPKGKGSRDRFFDAVSPEYFATVGMAVLKGRAFAAGDGVGAEPVVIIDQNMANDFFPGEDPLSKCVIVGARTTPCRRVVGVVQSAHHSSVVEDPSQHYYVPLQQAEGLGSVGAIAVRSMPGVDMNKLRPVIMQQISAELGSWARTRTRSMDEIIARDMRPWKTGATLFTTAGLLALLVAAVGVYSSLAYSINQRTQEMGVRVALGASASSIMRLVVGQSVAVVAMGVAVGVVASLALGKVIASMLFETSPKDPVVLIAAVGTLLIVAAIASSVPAWRASRVDPLTAMRAE